MADQEEKKAKKPAKAKDESKAGKAPKAAKAEGKKADGKKAEAGKPEGDKVVINMGIGEAVADRKKVESAAVDLALIAGQRPVITKSRKAISTYKLRENQPIGCKVTLRKTRMFEFIDRLINIALPRVRDFRGLNPKS